MKLQHNKHPPQHPIAGPGAFLNTGMIQYTRQSKSGVRQATGTGIMSGWPFCLFEVKSKWMPQG